MPHLRAGPQSTTLTQTLMGHPVLSLTLKSPHRGPYFSCLPLPYSGPHQHVRLVDQGCISLGDTSRAVSEVPAEIDEPANDEVSGGIY